MPGHLKKAFISVYREIITNKIANNSLRPSDKHNEEIKAIINMCDYFQQGNFIILNYF